MSTLRMFVTLVSLAVLTALAGCRAVEVRQPVPTLVGDALRVEHAWIRPAGAGGNSALYLTLMNLTDQPERLLRVETPVAASAELHETQNDNGMMRMRPLVNGLEIPANQGAELRPGGKHVMLLNVAAPLTAGQAVEVTLILEQAGRVTLVVPVAEDTP